MKALLIVAPLCASLVGCAAPQDDLNRFFVAEQTPTLRCFAALQAKSEHFTQRDAAGFEPTTGEISAVMSHVADVCDSADELVSSLQVPELDDKAVTAKLYRAFEVCKIGQSNLSRHTRRMADLLQNGISVQAGIEADQITKGVETAVAHLESCSKSMTSALDDSEYTFPTSEVYAASERLMEEAREDVASLAATT